MAVSDLPLQVPPGGGTPDAGVRTTGLWRFGALAVGCGLAVVGIGLVFVATMALDRQGGLVRWVVALVGILIAFRGCDLAAKAHFGPQFQTGFWMAVAWVVIVVALALLAPLLPIQRPDYLPLTTPSYLRPDIFHTYPLGTDGNGRDVLSRLIWGSRISLLLGVGCTAIGVSVGIALGVLAAHYRGSVAVVVRIVADTLLAFPPLVFLLALVAVLKPNVGTLFFAFTLLVIPSMIRLSRATAERIGAREYVTAARGLGARGPRIMVRELLPGVARVLLPYTMVIVASLIIAAASLSFLGLGVQAPNPSWGNMIADAQSVLQQDPQGVLVPAVVLFLTVVAFNRLGEGARQRTDARGSVLG